MGFGTVQVGRLRLREALTPATEAFDGMSGGRKLSITGQEASPPLSIADVAAVHDDVLGLPGSFVPVTFTDKADRNGYYQVTDANASLTAWGSEVVTCDWTIGLARVGADSEVDVESRLAGPLTRSNTHAGSGERWHAPPVGHTAYWSAATVPSTMVRTGADGAMTVYRGVPVGVNPRFACPVDAYELGRVRFLDALGRERSGVRWAVDPVGWELSNSLTRVTWDAVGLKVAAWDPASEVWESKGFAVTVSGTTLRTPDHATVIRNDYEVVIVRLLWSLPVAGRTSVDVTLRRGARLAEFYVSASPAGTITAGLEVVEATTAGSGWITATSNDPAGNRYMVASAGTFTASTPTAKISVSSASNMDFAAGLVVGGSSAVSGDGASALYAQLLGSAPERVQGIRR